MKNYDIIIVGAGAGGVFLSYEFTKLNIDAKVLMLDKGVELSKRICPLKAGKTENCIKCNPCHVMNGFGGAGTLSDGKYNITTKFGGDLHKYVGEKKAIELMEYVDKVLCSMGGSEAKLYSTATTDLKTEALKYDLHLLDAKVRHLGTDRNREILGKIFCYIRNKIDIKMNTPVDSVKKDGNYFIVKDAFGEEYKAEKVILATGRSGSKWLSGICKNFGIKQIKNRVDIGVRIELPAEIFNHITDEVY